MGRSRKIITRYSSYYHGWCLAFGEHQIRYDEDQTINWVEGDSQMGFVVSTDKTKPLYRELLRHRDESPTVDISTTRTKINDLEYEFAKEELAGASRFIEYAQKHKQLHMYLTSHFCYPPRTRIITFSPKKPPVILYKEISPLYLILP